jgi:serine phosphatase RsbU (regulator of sigma subunit)
MTSVAGDFYDFIQIDDKHIGILIADVSGHGLPSALIASMLQVALTGQAGHASEPAQVLAGLNRALRGKFTHNFVIAAYVYLDLEKNFMRYAGAGQPPVLQWRISTGKPQRANLAADRSRKKWLLQPKSHKTAFGVFWSVFNSSGARFYWLNAG